MPKLSRRTLIAALPLALDPAPALHPLNPDPLLKEIRAWTQAHRVREAMLHAFSESEERLFLKARALGLSANQMLRSPLDEAKALKILSRDIKNADRKLDRAAARIAGSTPKSPETALAQIDMGLLIQGPYDWDDHAYALIQSGRAQLWRLLAR
ncbi:MAG: hypothetical protein M0D54_17825 [Hyphomonadaceae bacterium JAD_PAG50586_4]|nr:MAG: hypothetical protein M0D54_17825 [Hyphomonadaceae bacterium JAD_PAG50586_4]